jgi:CRP-like cAMP-binding protein
MILETKHSIAEILSRQPTFRALGGLELARLSSATLEYRIGKHEVLYQKGVHPTCLHLVVTGQVKLFLPSTQGSEKIVRLVNPGEMFGEESVVLDQPYPMTAQATRDCILLVVPRPALMAAVADNPDLCRDLLNGLARRMHDLIDNMESCTQRSSAQRVAHYLTQLAPSHMDNYEIELNVNKQNIASHLNLAPETFSRVLNRFVQEGCIEMNGRFIRVANAAQLRMHAC